VTKARFEDGEVDRIQRLLKESFELVRLVLCATCKLFYDPNNDRDCFKYPHRGRQVPFESGAKEEGKVDATGRARVYCKWTCCGVIPKEATPELVKCVRKPNGVHEIDTGSLKGSKFETLIDELQKRTRGARADHPS
jgi:hypothetical protein